MKKDLLLISALIFISLQLCFGASMKKAGDEECDKQTDTIIKNLSVAQADSLMQTNIGNPNFVIIDVRTPGEYNAGYIQGAININYNAANFGAIIDTLNKNKMYLVYCGSGTRSAKARDTMDAKHFTEVYNMLGGTSAWVGAGHSLVVPTVCQTFNKSFESTIIYPNPVNNISTIKVNGTDNLSGTLTVYDIFGRLIVNDNIEKGNTFIIDNKNYNAGIYIYHVTAGNKLIGSGKFEVIK